MTDIKKSVKTLFDNFIKSRLGRSIFASLRLNKPVSIEQDKDKDYIYRWGNEAAITSIPDWNPINSSNSLDLFFYSYHIKKGDTVVIVGVADGAEIPSISRMVGNVNSGKVIAIEPTPSCVRRLKKLKKILSLENLVIVEAAIGSMDEEVYLNLEDNDIRNQITLQKNDQNSIKVNSYKLTSIMEKLSIEKIDYCKINIEGAEKNALIGIDLGKINIKNFCISTHDFIGPSFRTFDFVRDWLTTNNYNVSIYPEKLEKYWENYYVYGIYK